MLTLAGVIAHDQNDLPAAERDLRAARDQPRGESNCTAAFYLARVVSRTERYVESADIYERAMACYDRRIDQSHTRIGIIRANDEISPTFKARRIAQLEQSIVESRRSYHACAFNGATDNARIGRFTRSRELLEIAARDSALAEPSGKSALAAADPDYRHRTAEESQGIRVRCGWPRQVTRPPAGQRSASTLRFSSSSAMTFFISA